MTPVVSLERIERLEHERDEAREQLATTQAIARMLQVLVIEILGTYTGNPFSNRSQTDMRVLLSRATPEDVKSWRKRAGLDPA